MAFSILATSMGKFSDCAHNVNLYTVCIFSIKKEIIKMYYAYSFLKLIILAFASSSFSFEMKYEFKFLRLLLSLQEWVTDFHVRFSQHQQNCIEIFRTIDWKSNNSCLKLKKKTNLLFSKNFNGTGFETKNNARNWNHFHFN